MVKKLGISYVIFYLVSLEYLDSFVKLLLVKCVNLFNRMFYILWFVVFFDELVVFVLFDKLLFVKFGKEVVFSIVIFIYIDDIYSLLCNIIDYYSFIYLYLI